MSDHEQILRAILTRLQMSLGPSSDALGRDNHWSIDVGPQRAPINVLLDSTNASVGIWVFDPHSQNDGVMRNNIHTSDDVDDVLATIQQRVEQAQSHQIK